jgi:transcription antitermination factor NusG
MSCDWSEVQNRWLALQVRSGWEFLSSSCLRDRGYDVFCPTYLRRRKWADRVKILQVPLFPGYLFVRFHSSNGQLIISVPGVMRFLCIDKRPIPIDDDEIRSLAITQQAGLACGPSPFLQVGQQVEICEGPLSGLRGQVVRTKGKQRLVVSVTLLRKSVFVEIDEYKVAARPLGERPFDA